MRLFSRIILSTIIVKDCSITMPHQNNFIGASLSEPLSVELADAFLWYIYIYILY